MTVGSVAAASAGVVGGAGAVVAALVSPWPLLVIGVLAAAVLAVLAMVVLTAIFSRDRVRRQQATAVLDRLISALPSRVQSQSASPPDSTPSAGS